MNRCRLCKIALEAAEDTTKLPAFFKALSETKWWNPILQTQNWGSERSVKEYFGSLHVNDSLNAVMCSHAKRIASTILFERFPTKWELAEKNKKNVAAKMAQAIRRHEIPGGESMRHAIQSNYILSIN